MAGTLSGVTVKLVLGGRYELLDQLGSGGMAVVWRARDEVLGRFVAVKVLAGPHVDDVISRRRIRDEARAAAALSHPNIAQVYDFGESHTDGTCTPYVVMELVVGCTLAERMAAGPVAPTEAFRICAEVAAGLAAAHADGLVHRDIKPANVMVTPAGAKVVDFGIAAAVGGDRQAPEGELFGTPAYLAPERLLGDTVEPASDVYALGLLLYRLLTGHSPWDVDTTTKMLAAHVYVEPEPLPQLPQVPDYVVSLVNRCLLKDLTLRPTARDVAAVLGRAADARPVGVPPATPAPAGAIPAPRRPAAGPVHAGVASVAPVPAPGRRRRRVLLAAGAVAAVLAAGSGWLLTRPDAPRQLSPGAGAVAPAQQGTSGPASGLPTVRGAAAPSRGAGPAAPTAGSVVLPGAQPEAAPDGPGSGTDPVRNDPDPDPAPTEAGPAPTADPEPTRTTRPPAQQRTLTAAGGSVEATCTSGDDAKLLSWTPTKPYKVKDVDPGPAASAKAEFKHGNRTSTITVTCTAGIPSAG
jgi:hypothetical protein